MCSDSTMRTISRTRVVCNKRNWCKDRMTSFPFTGTGSWKMREYSSLVSARLSGVSNQERRSLSEHFFLRPSLCGTYFTRKPRSRFLFILYPGLTYRRFQYSLSSRPEVLFDTWELQVYTTGLQLTWKTEESMERHRRNNRTRAFDYVTNFTIRLSLVVIKGACTNHVVVRQRGRSWCGTS